MSSELYDKFARMNRIDHAIFESEQEINSIQDITVIKSYKNRHLRTESFTL